MARPFYRRLEAGLFARLHGHRTLKRLVDAARIAPKESAGAACLARDADRYHALRDDLLPYRRWLAFPEPVDVCGLRLGYLTPELRPARASD